MRFFIHCSPKNHQMVACSMMAEGLKRIGHEQATVFNDPKIDFYLTWAWKPFRAGSQWDQIARTGKPCLVMENGYLGDRKEWMSAGWNGINGNAIHMNQHDSDLGKFKTNFSKLLYNWRSDSDLANKPVVIVGQCGHDATVAHVNINLWYNKTIKKLRELGHEVRFRPHPLNRMEFDNVYNARYDSMKPLEEALLDYSACVTFNSNSGVISMLSGTPTFCADKGSMVWGIASNNLDKLNEKPDRDQWLAKISHAQWNHAEFKSGKAAKKLLGFFNE